MCDYTTTFPGAQLLSVSVSVRATHSPERCQSMIMAYPEVVGFKKFTLSLTDTFSESRCFSGIAWPPGRCRPPPVLAMLAGPALVLPSDELGV